MLVLPASVSTGFSLGLGLIVAIGAQNAFVLKQGLHRRFVSAVALTCALSDAILIFFGVTSFSRILQAAPWIDPVMRWGGAAFLTWYGFRSLLSALRSNDGLVAEGGEDGGLVATLTTCLALTWLNPHVYLDTVVLVGTLSTRFPGEEMLFAAGASSASFLFFFSLAHGAAWLRPLFAKPMAWRILDGLIAGIMWWIAGGLILGD